MRTVRYRLATPDDVYGLAHLYQKGRSGIDNDPLFLDYNRLREAIQSRDSFWVVTEAGGSLLAVILVLVDRQQRMGKIARMIVDSELPDARKVLRASLRHVLHDLRSDLGEPDLLYTTTLSISLDQQEITLLEGFRIMGVFPNALGADSSKLNGLTVWYAPGVLESRRVAGYALHPVIRPFYEICRKQLGLSELPVAGNVAVLFEGGESGGATVAEMPPLEVVRAPRLVERKFDRLRERRSQVINFYPFYRPNAVICDPDQGIEIYVRIMDALRFAAIIGEHLERAVHPVALYESMLQHLRAQGVSYVEVINDAADTQGISCILEAGFTPCAFIPGFKRQGETRRDYVVFGKSFEYLCQPEADIEEVYMAFFKQYFRIERKNYFRRKR